MDNLPAIAKTSHELSWSISLQPILINLYSVVATLRIPCVSVQTKLQALQPCHALSLYRLSSPAHLTNKLTPPAHPTPPRPILPHPTDPPPLDPLQCHDTVYIAAVDCWPSVVHTDDIHRSSSVFFGAHVVGSWSESRSTVYYYSVR